MIRAGRHQAIGVWADEKRVRVDIRGACMAHSARSPEAELAEHPAIAIDDTAIKDTSRTSREYWRYLTNSHDGVLKSTHNTLKSIGTA